MNGVIRVGTRGGLASLGLRQVAGRGGLALFVLTQVACAGSLDGGVGSGGAASGGAASGGAASGGVAGASPKGGASATSGDAGASRGDWPDECFPAAATQAGEALFIGPAGVASSGEPAQTGEAMRVRFNGFERTFDRFEVSERGVSGYGFDGGVRITVPRAEPGKYRCPEATITYTNQDVGAREFNVMSAEQCCVVEITRAGPLGEPIEGTFSGVLYGRALLSWTSATEGEFTVLNRAGGMGGFGGNANGF